MNLGRLTGKNLLADEVSNNVNAKVWVRQVKPLPAWNLTTQQCRVLQVNLTVPAAMTEKDALSAVGNLAPMLRIAKAPSQGPKTIFQVEVCGAHRALVAEALCNELQDMGTIKPTSVAGLFEVDRNERRSTVAVSMDSVPRICDWDQIQRQEAGIAE
jgi:hypothetical protein